MIHLEDTMQFDLKNLSREEALVILNLPNESLPELLTAVYEIRKTHKGNAVNVQLLTNARSGNCTQNCAYCAQSHDSGADIDRYESISRAQLLTNGAVISEQNLARHCIGFSGMSFTDQEITRFAYDVRELKKEHNTPICCSIGFLTREQAQQLKAAGVDRINHNLNTSRRFYPQICSTHTYEARIANIKMLQGIGFEICCGGIIGLGETNEDVVDMLFEIKAIRPQAVPVNFLIPVKGTALEQMDTSRLTPEFCLKVLCLARIVRPNADIRAAAGRELYLKGREKEMFYVVDSIFASGYLTEKGQSLVDTIQMIREAGFTPCVEGAVG
ncbi:biotin synthase [Clostridia bacterium]|nr:biotin synthase [Clostridia bacterium]